MIFKPFYIIRKPFYSSNVAVTHMDIEEKLSLVKQVGEEIITEPELRSLFETKAHPIAYDGMEPSGKLHIAQGILRAVNTNRLTKTGIKFKFWVADWFAWANNKLGGDLEKIQTCGKYMVEVWKSCGMDMKNVEFLWSKDVMADDAYWKIVMNIARNTTVKRILRCSQIMGREESDALQASQIFYPCMQCADVFHLKADITQLGMDQRKVNVLAREIGPKLGFYKPIIISSHMLMGLGAPTQTTGSAVDRAIELKMSKSKPETAIFMTDTEQEIKNKISKAYCPVKQVEENPILEYAKHIVCATSQVIKIDRPAKFGGAVEYESYDAIAKDYRAGKLHPADLKNAMGHYVNELVLPVRRHFEKNKKAKELKKEVDSFQITR